MKKFKKWAGVVAFWLIFAALFQYLNALFIPKDNLRKQSAAFYQQQEQTMDVIYIGSSNTLRAVSPMEIWREYGITGYSMATTLQAPIVSLAFAKQLYQTQQPEVVVFGFEGLFREYDYVTNESQPRYALDGMPISWAKLEAAQSISEQDPSQTVLSFLFPLLRYHTRWIEISDYSLPEKEPGVQMGYVGMNQSQSVELSEDYMSYSGQTVDYSEENLQYFRQAVEYCKEQGSQVLLVKFPRIDWTAEQAEAEQAFADELGVPLLDLNEQACWEATDLDPELDFYDFNHVSTTGATKLSHYLGAYLQENYGLTDKRADPAYASWNENVPEYEEEFAFCLHMVTGEDGLTFRMEASQAFLERNQIAPEDLTYSWTLYRDNKLLQTVENTTSSSFKPELEGTGTYIAACSVYCNDAPITVYVNGESAGSLESLPYVVE